MLFNAGDHEPEMPLLDIVGNAFKFPPEHIGAAALNVGTTGAFTAIVSVVVVAHDPVAGVNI